MILIKFILLYFFFWMVVSSCFVFFWSCFLFFVDSIINVGGWVLGVCVFVFGIYFFRIICVLDLLVLKLFNLVCFGIFCLLIIGCFYLLRYCWMINGVWLNLMFGFNCLECKDGVIWLYLNWKSIFVSLVMLVVFL